MGKIFLFFAFLSLPNTLWAADPIIGTWKLNEDKSTLSPTRQESAEERIDVYSEIEGDQIELKRSPSGSIITWPRQGGIATSTRQFPDSDGFQLVQTLIAPGEWYVTYIEDGKQVMLMHKVVSKDGMTMTATIKGTDDRGGFTEQTRVYIKQ